MSGAPRPTVAAIVPVYNQRATVCEAIDSILEQTRPADEILVVDDGSTDGAGDLVAERYGDRVHLLRQDNRGAGAARNTGIQAARSDLVTFLDADDRWLPTKLQMQAAFMEEHPSCRLSFSAWVLCDELHGETRVEGMNIDKATYLATAFFREECLPAANSVMVRREVLEEVGGFDESLRKCQDTDLWLRIMIRHGFEHLPEPLVWVRRGPHRTEPDLSKWFIWHERYFAKHRYTFGRGLKGQITWRRGYSSVLRKQAVWYFRHRRGARAMAKVLKSVWIWPLFDSTATLKAGLEYLLGPRLYGCAAAAFRTVTGRKAKVQPDE